MFRLENYDLVITLWFSIMFTSLFDLSYEADCIFSKTVRNPTVTSSNRNKPFGNIYKLENKQIQNATKCTWILSTSQYFALNVLFINSTFSKKPLDAVCSEDYVIVRQQRSGDGLVKAWQPYCGQRELPDIRINGTVEIELNFKSNKSDGKDVSMTVYAEASSKSCGDVFNDSAFGIPLSYKADEFDFASSNNIAHCVWFFKFNINRSVSVVPSAFNLARKMYGHCRYYKEFFSIRRWSNGTNDFVVDLEKCSTMSQRLPIILKSLLGFRFALTIHSEYRHRYDEKLEMVYFPTSQGIKKEQTIDGYNQEKYNFQSSNKLNRDSVILVKRTSKDKKKDYIYMLIHDIRISCEGALIEAWSLSSDVLQKNRTIVANRSMDSSFVLVAEQALLIYFRFYPSKETNSLKMSYFPTNTVCGGIFKLSPGQNISIRSPTDGSGYPKNSDCRWAILAERSTKLNISTVYLEFEDDRTCTLDWDYIAIFGGFRHNRTISKKICKPLKSSVLINGDCIVYFHSDILNSNYDGFHIIISATQDKNFTRQPTTTTYTKPCDKLASTTQLTSTNKIEKDTTTTLSTPKSKVTEKKSKQKSSSSNIKTYLVSSLAAVAGIICAACVAAIIIRRRRRSNLRSEAKNDPPGPNHERKRQNSTMPLVPMDDLRKPSLPENSYDTTILENVPGETVFAETENPYYAPNSNVTEANKEMKEAINPYYMTSQEEMTQPVYADVFENVYAEPKKAMQEEYSYADFQESCKDVDGQMQNNMYEYEYASTNDRVENEYEI